MLRTLIIQNLILIEEAHISFEKGLTIITGETGSGKTALTEAIRLILGERADATKVRKGCEKAFIQAAFDLEPTREIEELFSDFGLPLSLDEELILTREILASGKSRSFVSGLLVPANFLHKLAPFLIDFIGQHGQIALKSHEHQRELVDLYGDIDLSSFHGYWEKEKELESELATLQSKKQTSGEKQQLLKHDLEELLKVNPQEGEEESLFEEYTLLANSEELISTTCEIGQHLEEALSHSSQIAPLFERIIKYHAEFEESEKLAREAHLILDELNGQIVSFQSKIERDPHRLLFLEDRLKILDTLKKKHGKDLAKAREILETELENLEKIDERIQALQIEFEEAKKATKSACVAISKQRKEKSSELEKILSEGLKELNIPHAEFSIRIEPTKRSLSGEDQVVFYLRANIGEESVPVKDSSSGGELSRLLFSLKIALAEKNQPQTMIFDEIDSNVGGETATIIGKKLKQLGEKGQVLCITHFPQVASLGNYHLCVSKQKQGDRTLCRVDPLDEKGKEKELLRMLGGEATLIHR